MSLADDLEAQAAKLEEEAEVHQRQAATLRAHANALRQAAQKVRGSARLTVTTLTEAGDHDTMDDMANTDRGAAISAGKTAGRPRDKAIRKLLKETGLKSLTAVAKAIGVSPAMMSYVVAGVKQLGPENAAALEAIKAARKPVADDS